VREFSVPPVATIADDANLTDPVWTNAQVAPEAPQFARPVDGGWEDVSCAGFKADVVALAKGLIAAGISPGDRVGLMSKTRYEWTLIDYAVWSAGAVTVPIYETSSTEQVNWILSDSGAVACFVETIEHARTAEVARADISAMRTIWGIDAGRL
jgi:long-chain acyl-CoA synthetase